MISTPLSSSPWIAAFNQTVGPGRIPLITAIGSESDVSVGSRATGSSMWRRVPGVTVTPPMTTGSLRGRALPLDSVTSPVRLRVRLEEFDDLARHVDVGGAFDPFEP